MRCFCSSLRPGQKVLIVCKMRSAGGSIPSLRRRSTQARIKVISCRMTVCIFPVERGHSKRPRAQSSKARGHPLRDQHWWAWACGAPSECRVSWRGTNRHKCGGK